MTFHIVNVSTITCSRVAASIKYKWVTLRNLALHIRIRLVCEEKVVVFSSSSCKLEALIIQFRRKGPVSAFSAES